MRSYRYAVMDTCVPSLMHCINIELSTPHGFWVILVVNMYINSADTFSTSCNSRSSFVNKKVWEYLQQYSPEDGISPLWCHLATSFDWIFPPRKVRASDLLVNQYTESQIMRKTNENGVKFTRVFGPDF